MKYYKYSKKQFEYKLKGILIENKIGFLNDITNEWREEGNETWETIYKVSTKNKALSIIIFSSIDIKTEKVRDIGGDAVRIVLAWNTKNGVVYKHIAKHYRVEGLFENLKTTLLKIQPMVFNLNYKDFTKAI